VQDSARFFSARGWLARETDAARDYLASLLPMAVGSVDRLEEIPERVAFVFEWDAARAAELTAAEADGARAVAAFAAELSATLPLDRDAFRAAAARAREKTGLKGRGLFHPIRVALTAAESGPELDLAVPAIDRGAALPADSGLAAVLSCAERVRRVAEHLAQNPGTSEPRNPGT
jgi:glutamyl/glutaminyl-tRNA synthetase